MTDKTHRTSRCGHRSVHVTVRVARRRTRRRWTPMGKGQRGPSMHDVAARAGVSHQTVSRVLNDFPGIRPETRNRVLEAIDALGYRRNFAARALVTGRTHTIGMVGPRIPDIGPLSTLHSVEGAARTAGFHSLMTSADPAVSSITEALNFLVGRSVDAIALVSQ